MKGIFICYRREDTSGYAGRLFDHLKERFGQDRVFLDVAGIEPGVDFVETIDREVGSCDALVIMMGRMWVDCADQNGQRRLDDQQDFIRLEVATALRRNIRVIPVLVQGAVMPKESDLPEEIKLLARRQAFEISDSHWGNDVQELVKTLGKVLNISANREPEPILVTTPPIPPKKQTKLIALIVSILIIVVAGVAFINSSNKKEVPKGPLITNVAPPRAESEQAAVPDITGSQEEAAIATLKESGFLKVHEQTKPSEKPQGTVLSQQPIAGSVMVKNSTIELIVAEKPPKPKKKTKHENNKRAPAIMEPVELFHRLSNSLWNKPVRQ